MRKYIVLYHAPAEILQGSIDATPEQMAEGMKPWMDWAARCGERLLDLGTPLTGGQKISVDGSITPSVKEVCGYSMLQANSLEEARALLEGHPHLSWNGACEIEIHESIPLTV